MPSRDPQERSTDAAVKTDIIALVPILRKNAWFLTRRWDVADDLVQDTLLKAIENIDRFEPGTNLRAWLARIMRNIFLNDLRVSTRERPGEADCASVSSRASTPATQDWAIRGREALDAIDGIPEPYRRMFRLVVLDGETYEDSARLCDCAMGTVKSRVNRARQMVIERISDRSV